MLDFISNFALGVVVIIGLMFFAECLFDVIVNLVLGFIVLFFLTVGVYHIGKLVLSLF